MILATGPVAAATVDLSEGSVHAGGETTLILTLDEAPDGFAGYFVSISVDPEYVRIVDVKYPEWATMKKTGGLDEGTDVRLKTVDLKKAIGPGATDIELARITFRGIKDGSSKIGFYAGIFSDDSDNEINPVLPEPTIVISGSSTESGIIKESTEAQVETGAAESLEGGGSSTPPVYFAVTAVILLVVVLAVVIRRRRREDEYPDWYFED